MEESQKHEIWTVNPNWGTQLYTLSFGLCCTAISSLKIQHFSRQTDFIPFARKKLLTRGTCWRKRGMSPVGISNTTVMHPLRMQSRRAERGGRKRTSAIEFQSLSMYRRLCSASLTFSFIDSWRRYRRSYFAGVAVMGSSASESSKLVSLSTTDI